MSDVDPRSVPCPACGARAGSWCKRPSGHSGPFVEFHTARRKAAEAAQTQAAPVSVRVWALDARARAKAEQGGEVLVFVRLGDFYEAFGDDAVQVSAALDIVLTSIPHDGRRVPMSGVPAHVAENYFARLLATGHKLAVVEPDETVRALTAAVAEEAERPRPIAATALPVVAIPAAVFGVPVQLTLF